MVYDQKKNKWLVIGADGMIGSSLMAYLHSTGKSALGSVLFPDDNDSYIFHHDLTDNLSKWKPPEGLSFAYFCVVSCAKVSLHLSISIVISYFVSFPILRFL